MARVREGDLNAKTESMFDLGSPLIDWLQISSGLGVPATQAKTAEEFHEQFATALTDKGPRLIECQVAVSKEMLALTQYVHKTR